MKHKITLLIFLLFAFFQEAYAQSTFNAGAGNWNLDTNWLPIGIPGIGDDVIIPAGRLVLVASTAEANSIQNNGILTVFSTGSLTVAGLIENLGVSTLTIASDASDNGSIIVGSYSGNAATYQRYLTGGGSNWHLLSTPLTSGGTISDFISTYGASMAQDGVKYSLGTYDNNFAADGFSTWRNYTSDLSNPAPATAFPAGVGYEILMTGDGTVDFTGNINTTGATFTLTENVTGWNLIGNPFPSSVSGNINADANNFLTVNTGLLDPSFVSMYIWNPIGGSYDIVNQASGARYLAPGQAFFVKRIPVASFPGSADVVLNTSMRIHQTTNNFQKTATTNIPTINLTVDNNTGTVKSTEIKYMSGTTLGLDPGYDAGQFGGLGTSNFNLYTQLVQDNGVKFALQVVPDTDYETTVIPIGVNANSGTQLTFKATATDLPVGKKVILEDKLLNTFAEVNQTDKFYTVTLSSNLSGTGRFFLHTVSNSLSIDEDDFLASKYKLATSAEQQNIRLYGAVTEKGAMNIFDTFGRKIYTTTLQIGTEQDINMPKIATGIYIVKFNIDNKSFSKKIMWY